MTFVLTGSKALTKFDDTTYLRVSTAPRKLIFRSSSQPFAYMGVCTKCQYTLALRFFLIIISKTGNFNTIKIYYGCTCSFSSGAHTPLIPAEGNRKCSFPPYSFMSSSIASVICVSSRTSATRLIAAVPVRRISCQHWDVFFC